ncbi:hypothetical protein GW17_00059611 [Ensete ventricosum]|nr:hypothetical protein GW17_00059611 [Ensete ventricosum]
MSIKVGHLGNRSGNAIQDFFGVIPSGTSKTVGSLVTAAAVPGCAARPGSPRGVTCAGVELDGDRGRRDWAPVSGGVRKPTEPLVHSVALRTCTP